METIAPPVEAPVEPDPVLLEAARLLREGWAQHDMEVEPPFYLRIFGARTRYCLVGAIDEAIGGADLDFLPFIQALGFDGECEAAAWNDDAARTPEEVVARVERAAYGF